MSAIKKEISCQMANINDNYLDSIHLIDYLECSREVIFVPFSGAIEFYNKCVIHKTYFSLLIIFYEQESLLLVLAFFLLYL